MALIVVLPLLAAAPATSPEQLLQTAIDGIESESEDAVLARQIERTRLMERLSDDEVRWLSTAGAGPSTLKALRKLQERSAPLPASVPPVVAFAPRPTAEERNHMLQQVISYVQRYTSTLVDFTCTVNTRTYTKERSESRPLSDTSIVITAPSTWQQGKTVTQEISYYQGREYTSSESRTKQNAAQGLTPGASWTDGEFAQALRITFATSSQARFDWNHWERHGGKRLAVFSYSVGAAHSQLAVNTQISRSGVWQNAQLLAAYRGFFYADPESGSIYRLTANTVEVPSAYAINQGNTVLDYGPVDIAGRTYFLLTDAMSYISTKQYQALFRKTFTGYRKFETESKILGVTIGH
jgi:hypothetical protein